MKKMLFALSALAALTLVAPSPGFAQHDYDNQFGIFVDIAATQNNFSVPTSTPFTGYLVLLQPTDNLGAPVAEVEAFEVMLTFDQGGLVFKLAEVLPPGAINIGEASNPADGLDYTVGIATPVVVTNEATVLVTFTFMTLTPTPVNLFLVDSRAGNMQFQEAATASLVPAYPSSSDQALPVASFNGGVVATEDATWGDLKALYR